MGWDDNGLPTERRVQNYFGVRCDPSLPVRPGLRAAGEAGRSTAIPISRPQLRRALRPARRRGRAEVRGALAPARAVGRLVADVHDDRRAARGARRSGRSSATSPAARRTRPRRRRCGTSTSAPRSRRPSSRTARCRARTTRSRFHGADGAGDIVIETTRPELIPACVALVAHPDDERYQTAFGTEVRTPLFGVRGAGARAPARRPREGVGHRDDLHLRRHHRRHVVARARSSRRAPCIGPRRAAASPTPPDWGATPTPRPTRGTRELAGKTVEAGAARGSSSCSRESRRARRRAEADHAPGEVLREGRPSARDRHARGSGTSATAAATRSCARALLARGRELHWHPPHMRSALRDAGSRGSTATGSSAGSASSVCRSRSGTRSTTTASRRLRRTRSLADRGPRCPSTRRATCPTGTPRTSGASPAGSSATPT